MAGKAARSRWKLKGCLAAVVFGVGVVIAFPYAVRELGGAFDHEPGAMADGLGPGARALLGRVFEGLDGDDLFDYHCHVVGLGAGETGAFLNDKMRSWLHPAARIRFEIYKSASGITDVARADQQYVERLAALARAIPRHGKHLLLAFDRHYTAGGEVDLEQTEFYVPNDYVFELAEEYPDVFVPAISVHPYRKDALEELKRGRDRGARIVKWLPNAQGIDPADPRCAPFFAKMKEYGMILLTHAGEELAVDAAEAQELGNPLRLRRALDAGVKVIVAHCASLGQGEDLDRPGGELRDNLDLFLRLMDESKYRKLLFGEISALTQSNRVPRALLTMLQRRDLHDRLVNGSDYPIPAINVAVRTRALVDAAVITEEERTWLNEIYEYNPLLFDLAVKRTVKLPGTSEGFPASVFRRHRKLDPGR